MAESIPQKRPKIIKEVSEEQRVNDQDCEKEIPFSGGKQHIFDTGSGNWEKENPLVEREYSYEEKRWLKALVDGKEYDKWQKQNQLWEVHTGREARWKYLPELSRRLLTEEEERLKQTYLENMDKARLGAPFDPYGPGWELAYYSGPNNLRELYRKYSALPPPQAPERLLFKKKKPAQGHSTVSPCVISTEEKREKLAAQGRCLSGSYLTPYCKCDTHKCTETYKIPLEDNYPQEYVPFQLAYRRQCRQSHCFDIDDEPGSPFGTPQMFGGTVGSLEPSGNFNGKAKLLMELANLAIQEYNVKECNVFKYKVLKIEKVNCIESRYDQYWMTVKVLNLTLGTPIETFQIHAGMSFFGDDKKTYCCRLKEEAIVGLPSCEFCFGLLSEGHVTGRNGEALKL